MNDNLAPLGFDRWFSDHCDSDRWIGFDIARVISVRKEHYMLTDGRNEILGQLVGKMMYGADSPMDFPTVGDWVLARYYDGNSLAAIHEILPRRSQLRRKTSGKNVEFQVIGANIDTALIMQSLDDNFNLRRLERYLVMVNEGQIQPVVLLSKSDLRAPEEIAAKTAAINKIMPDLTVIPFSSKDGSGLQGIRDLLAPRQTYCLLGSSGVGKTTLLNHLVGRGLYATKEVRQSDGKGRHTTTQRDLICLEGGAMIIDSPGMRELGIMSSESGLAETFADIIELAEHCRFSDCNHVDTRGCSVLAALQEGKLSAERYGNYIKMNKETRFNEMSYIEKRRKDRRFGKMIKTVMKSKKNRI